MRLLLLATCLLACRCDEYEFWEACAAGDTAAMSELLETASDIDLDCPDDDGRTPLLLAALHDRAAAARFLLARGADAEAVGRWPGPPDGPLATAAALGHVATMDALLEAGASANAAICVETRFRPPTPSTRMTYSLVDFHTGGDGARRPDAPHRRRGIRK